MDGEEKTTCTMDITREKCQCGNNATKIMTVLSWSTGGEICTMNKYYKQCCSKIMCTNRQRTISFNFADTDYLNTCQQN